jgi:RNA polymerase sigma-70 factor, ECF subfamily
MPSALAARISDAVAPVTPRGHGRLGEQLTALAATHRAAIGARAREVRDNGANPAEDPQLTSALKEHLQLKRWIALERFGRHAGEAEVTALAPLAGRSEHRKPSGAGTQRAGPLTDPIPRRGSPSAIDVIAGAHTEPTFSRVASKARRLDRRSRGWLEALESDGLRREEAIRRLRALLLREARFEVARRTAPLSHPSGRDLDDLAVQAANDAVVAILAKLDHFRGDSLFTTWARRFVQREAPAKIRRRLGRARELPMELEFERARMCWSARSDSPHERIVAKESARTLARPSPMSLTSLQRKVLIALVVDGVPTQDLARHLDTTTGALYKTLHDARRKLRAKLRDGYR